MRLNAAQPYLPQPEGLSVEDRERSRHADAVAWGIFFIWVGVSMLAHLSWGWFLIGAGVLVMGAQISRWWTGLRVDRFWIACGAVFLAGGAWELLAIPWPLFPILLVLFGLTLLWKAVRH